MSEVGVNRQKPEPKLWEKIFVVITLVFSTSAIYPLVQDKVGVVIQSGQGNLLAQVLWSGIYLITFYLIIFYWRKAIQIAFRDVILWLLVGLAFVSTLWSYAPLETLRGSVALLGNTLIGIYLVTCYSRQKFLKLLLWALGLIVVLSLGLSIFLPDVAFHHFPGSMRGVLSNKNHFGPLMALAVITWLLYSVHSTKMRFMAICFCLLSFIFLLLSQCITAWIIFSILLPMVIIYYLLRHKRVKMAVPIILITLALCTFFFLITTNLNNLLELAGKNITLTGRTELWLIVWDMIQHQQPWLGFGYDAFWLGMEGPSGAVWEIISWNPPHAHNGYLDVWLQLGVVGIVIFIISFVINYFRAVLLACRQKDILQMFPLLILTFMIIHNLSESTFMVRNNFFWILYVVTSLQFCVEHKSFFWSAKNEN